MQCGNSSAAQLLWLSVFAFGIALLPAAHADTIYVCWDGSGDYLTIQEGIDAAQDGDEVVVCDGTYTGDGNRDLDFTGKAITVRSANGPENCVIDCQHDGRGFYFHSGETAASVVDSFTITNGDVAEGAGVYCINDSSPTITNCTITGNRAWSFENGIGGGVSCRNNSNAMITNCRIRGNSASAWADEGVGVGGGVRCYYSHPKITNCTISDNRADDGGGGLSCVYSSPTITNSTISGNSADWNAGGVSFSSNSNGTMTNCTISGNSAWGYSEGGDGGGVYCWQASPIITNCTISDNGAGYAGGVGCSGNSNATITNCTITGNSGFFCAGGVSCVNNSNATITNCTISGNSALSGAGMYNQSSNPTVTNCTFSGNQADQGGGMLNWSGDPTLANCILWDDNPDEIVNHGGAGTTVSYSDVQGGWPGEGNIDADPLFAGPTDYHLSAGSPCIDAADNTAVPADTFDLDEDGDTGEPIPFDLDGNPRFVDDPDTDDTGNPDLDYPDLSIVDMGAYEFQVCAADIDGDGDTDHGDLGALLGAWDSQPGDPNWNPNADLDADGHIGHGDLGVFLPDWGCGT